MTTRRAFTTSRIVALVVIGMVVLGLAYLRLTPGDESVVVPAGSRPTCTDDPLSSRASSEGDEIWSHRSGAR